MDQLTWEIWDTILKQLDTKSILSFADAISKNHQLQMLRSWLNTRPVPLIIDDDSRKDRVTPENTVTYEEFKKIAKILKWDLEIKSTDSSPCLIGIQQNIHSLSCETRYLSYIEDQLISKLVNLYLVGSLIDNTTLSLSELCLHPYSTDTTLSKFVNLSELCLHPSSTDIEIDLQNLSKLRSLEIDCGWIQLVSLPASLKSLNIYGSLSSSSINTNLNLTQLLVKDPEEISVIESLLTFCGQSLLKLDIGDPTPIDFYIQYEMSEDFDSEEHNHLRMDHLQDDLFGVSTHSHPDVSLYIGFGNEVNPGIENLHLEYWSINPSNPIEFNGTCLYVDKFSDSTNGNVITLDCDLLITENLQNFTTRSKLSKFPDFTNNIVSITIESTISHIPTLENLTNLKYLDICCDSHEFIINPPNLHQLELSGYNISKVIVNDSIKELDLKCGCLSSLRYISCFNTNEFPRLISSFSIRSWGITIIEEFQFPKSLRKLNMYGRQLRTIQNVTFEAGSYLNEFHLESKANFLNVLLPPNCKNITLKSDETFLNFESFQFPKYIETLYLGYDFSELPYSPILNISFQQLKYLKKLTLDRIRLLTTVNSPLLLPNSLEDLSIEHCITDTIDLKFQSGVTNLRRLVFYENFTSTSNREDKIFPTFTYKSLGHDNNTSHDYLDTIVSPIPPGNYEKNDDPDWWIPKRLYSLQIVKVLHKIYNGSPKNLRLVRTIGYDKPKDFLNPNL